jgi:hypothetical protein
MYKVFILQAFPGNIIRSGVWRAIAEEFIWVRIVYIWKRGDEIGDR